MAGCDGEDAIQVVAGLGHDGTGIEACLHLAGHSLHFFVRQNLGTHNSLEVKFHKFHSRLP